MKKTLTALFASAALYGLAGTALAQAPIAASPDAAVTADPSAAPDLMIQTSAQPKLKFKIKGVNADDDSDGEGSDDNGGHESNDGHSGDSHGGEGGGDNG